MWKVPIPASLVPRAITRRYDPGGSAGAEALREVLSADTTMSSRGIWLSVTDGCSPRCSPVTKSVDPSSDRVALWIVSWLRGFPGGPATTGARVSTTRTATATGIEDRTR
jgi:hypothetical protein